MSRLWMESHVCADPVKALYVGARQYFAGWTRADRGPLAQHQEIAADRRREIQIVCGQHQTKPARAIQLAEQKPALGWGYGSFDTVKNGPNADIEGVYAASVKLYTSHDTFLTMLVELGLVGVCLFAIPFLVVGTTSVRRMRSGGADAWVRSASVAALGVCVLSAMTFDTRFFSVAIVLPWIFLGLARRPLATGEAA